MKRLNATHLTWVFFVCAAAGVAGQIYDAPQWIMTLAWGYVVLSIAAWVIIGNEQIRLAAIVTFWIVLFGVGKKTWEALARMLFDSHTPWWDDLFLSQSSIGLMLAFFFFAFAFSQGKIKESTEHIKRLEAAVERYRADTDRLISRRD